MHSTKIYESALLQISGGLVTHTLPGFSCLTAEKVWKNQNGGKRKSLQFSNSKGNN